VALRVLAVSFLLLGVVLGDGLVLLTAGLSAGGAVLMLAAAFRHDQLGGDQPR
jgi:hypothetical protein